MSCELLKKYRPIADALLEKHWLNVRDETAEALAKRIMFEREGVAQKVRAKGQRNPATPSIRKAIKHNRALLRYAMKPPTRPGSIPIRQNALYDALNSLSVVVKLSLCQPPIDVNQILEALSDEKILCQDDLERLLLSLTAYIDGPRFRTGRPKDSIALIIASAVHTWISAGKESRYTCIEPDGPDEHREHDGSQGDSIKFLHGDFVDFLRDLFTTCEVDIPSDAAIQWRLRNPKNMFDLMKKSTTTSHF